MRYILNDSGYIEAISFGCSIECKDKTCTEYTGTIPEGYESLEEWNENANINAYKIVDGNLTFDSTEDTRLQTLWENQLNNGGGTSNTGEPNRDFIKVILSSKKTMTAGEYTKVPFDVLLEEINENDSFSFNNDGEITINSDSVKKVYVASSVLDSAWGANEIYLDITKNGITEKNSFLKGQSYIQIEVDLLVTKGDVISVRFYCSKAITLNSNKVYSQLVISV